MIISDFLITSHHSVSFINSEDQMAFPDDPQHLQVRNACNKTAHAGGKKLRVGDKSIGRLPQFILIIHSALSSTRMLMRMVVGNISYLPLLALQYCRV